MTKKQQTLTLRDNEIKNEISPKKGLNKTKQKNKNQSDQVNNMEIWRKN